MKKGDQYGEYKNNIGRFYSRNRRVPTYSEIMDLCGFASKNAASKLVHKLIDDGFLDKDVTGKIIPSQIDSPIKVLGVVEAGFGAPAEEEVLDTLSLDEYLIDNREATYMLEVKGDSMIDAGIIEGDMVLVERTQDYHLGDIVIAEIDGRFTMKYIRKTGSVIWLEPANKAYKPLYPTEDLKVVAVVKAVIRKYS